MLTYKFIISDYFFRERRETVRSISGVGVRALRGPFPRVIVGG